MPDDQFGISCYKNPDHMNITIREGRAEDVPAMMDLVKELAAFEKASDEVNNTNEAMLADGFGEHPVFKSFIAEIEGKMVGISIFYNRYSTWKGKRLYLEDIVVTEELRGRGVGKALFEKTMEVAKETGCTGMMWQVLDWNDSAINFYRKYNARFDDEWVNCHLDF